MKLKTLLLIKESVDDWDGIIEGNGFFCYRESNNWESKRSGASVYITEGEPHKYWIKVKTHGLRKPNDTHESYRHRVKKHTDKIARNWVTSARKLKNNPEINEVGNEIPITWKQAFREALNDPKISAFISEWGQVPEETDKQKITDPVNFSFITEGEETKVYGAVVLDKESQEKLISGLKDQIPNGWKVIAHHMTIQFPGFPDDKKDDLGKQVKLTATEIGKSEEALAVKVNGYFSKNKIPHITIAIPPNGKAVNSNNITSWNTITPIKLSGVVSQEKY